MVTMPPKAAMSMRPLAAVTLALLILSVPASAAAISIPNLIPASPSITQGQATQVFAGGVSGGTAPYSYQWYVKPPGSAVYVASTNASLSSYGCIVTYLQPMRLVFVAGIGADQGTYDFRVVVSDSSSDTANSSVAGINVTSYNATWPSASNTGVPAGTVLAPINASSGYVYGQYGPSDDYVIDSVFIYGPIHLYGESADPFNNITFQRFATEYLGYNNVDYEDLGIFFEYVNHTTLRQCTLNGSSIGTGTPEAYLTMEGCNVFNVGDMKIRTGFVIQNNYIHNLTNLGHGEDIYLVDGSGAQVRHNNLVAQNPSTASAALYTEGLGSSVTNATVDDNLLNGGAYCMSGSGTGPPYINGTFNPYSPPINEIATNNHFGTQIASQCGGYGPVGDIFNYSYPFVWVGNVWNATNAPLAYP